MKLFFDLFTVALFFVVYKWHGMYYAVAAAMLAYSLQILVTFCKHRSVDKMQLIIFVLILLLGGSTLLLHNEQIFKWKPTAIYWLFAVVFIGSHFVGQKPIIERLMEKNVALPNPVWKKLNISWIIFFILMGSANLFVAYHFDTNTWVNFKLFGVLGLTLVFVLLQAAYLTKHMRNAEKDLPKS
jgi:intracellular septation protein